MTQPEVAETLGILTGIYPSFRVTPDILKTWSLVLASDNVETVREAVLRLVRTSKFPPTIAEISEAASEGGMAIPDAESILGEVVNAVRDVGYVRVPNLSPIANAVVTTIGWRTLCDCENWDAMRAHVMRVAATYRRRAIEGGVLALGGMESPVPCPALEAEQEFQRRRRALLALAPPRKRLTLNEDDVAKMATLGMPNAGVNGADARTCQEISTDANARESR